MAKLQRGSIGAKELYMVKMEFLRTPDVRKYQWARESAKELSCFYQKIHQATSSDPQSYPQALSATALRI
jgi:hypothetical protein